MRCDDVRCRLDDLLDGSLPSDERARVERHLAGCSDCSNERDERASLVERTARLPLEIAPARDLWPGIAARLEPTGAVVRGRFGARRWLAVAAAAVLAAGSLLIAYSIGRQQGGSRAALTAEATPLAIPAALSDTGFAEAESEFAAARDTLLAALDSRRSSLSPETLRIVDENLRIIDDAIERLSAALVEDPLNPKLANQLASAYRRQIDLLQRASRLPAET